MDKSKQFIDEESRALTGKLMDLLAAEVARQQRIKIIPRPVIAAILLTATTDALSMALSHIGVPSDSVKDALIYVSERGERTAETYSESLRGLKEQTSDHNH